MTPTHLAVIDGTTYEARITPLKSGGRRDIEIAQATDRGTTSFAATNIVAQMRQFFAALDAEAEQHRDDPVALAQALARLDALLADVRTVRDSVRDMAARSLAAEKVRRLTIENVCTVEATTDTKRSNWDHQRLMTAMLTAAKVRGLTEDGEVLWPHHLAERVLAWMRPEWRMTPVRDAGLNPDDFCEVAIDDNGKPVREPSLRMVDNTVRKITTTTQEGN